MFDWMKRLTVYQQVAMKRWKIDTNSRQDAMLLLSSINLPGGVQRRKNETDELQMREFFSEGDVLVAEVQSFYSDGAMGLHTRGFKVCKLRNGSFVAVPPALVQRCKSQFHTLPCGVDVILGLNGYIWVSKKLQNLATEGEVDAQVMYSAQNDPILPEERQTIARVCNVISALARQYMHINDTVIVYAYEGKHTIESGLSYKDRDINVNNVDLASLAYSIKELLTLKVIEAITAEASARMRMP